MKKIKRQVISLLMAAIMLCSYSATAFAAEAIPNATDIQLATEESIIPASTTQTIYLQASNDATASDSGYFNKVMYGGTYTLYYFVSTPCDLWLNYSGGTWKIIHLPANGQTASIQIEGSALYPTISYSIWSNNGGWFSYVLRIVK